MHRTDLTQLNAHTLMLREPLTSDYSTRTFLLSRLRVPNEPTPTRVYNISSLLQYNPPCPVCGLAYITTITWLWLASGQAVLNLTEVT